MNDMILNLTDINKSFFGVQVLTGVNLSLCRGCVLGLIGENGAGKTTLMNIIGGVVQPETGTIFLNGEVYTPKNPGDASRAGIAFIHQELNLFTNLSIAENIFIDGFPTIKGLPIIDRRTIRKKTRELLKMVGMDMSPDTPVEKLSPGERQLVEISKAIGADAQVIIFDEPTTSLTARETEHLFALIRKLQTDGRSIIYISHILSDVLHLADEIVVLRDGAVQGSGTKEDFSIGRMISMMVGREIDQLYPPRTSRPSSEIAFEVRSLSQSGIVENICFSIHKGEVLGLFGLMGSGRTELARILFGLDPHEQGEIFVDGKALNDKSPGGCIHHQMAFVTENRREEGLLMEVSIAENMGLVALPSFSNSRLLMVEKARLYEMVGEVAQTLQIKASAIERQPVKSLSGGNQQKAVIGKWLMSKPSIFLMDEPTRGVDVGAKYEVYNIINDLAAQGTGVLFISSELEELIGVCDRIIVMGNGEIHAAFQRSEFNEEAILRAAFRENGNE